MSFNLSMLIGAIIKVASGWVPSTYRWALSIVADLLQQHQVKMGAAADQTTSAATPEDLKTIISGLFDVILSQLSGRLFLSSVVSAIRDFILNNLVDAIWSTLQAAQGGAVKMAAIPTNYHPAEATKLTATLDAAAKECCEDCCDK